MARQRLRFGQPCSIDGCNKPTLNFGWCSAHYMRWYRNGDPLAGEEPRGKCRSYVREVVMTYEGDDCLTWPFARNNKGYASIKVAGRRYIASRFVCEEHRGPPPSPEYEAAHSCGNGHLGCVTKSHLSWKTVIENAADRIIHGTERRGSRCSSAKLKEADVYAIRALAGSATLREIAREYGVSNVSISNILTKKTWRHLPEAPRNLFERIQP